MIKAVLVLFALLCVALASHGRYGNIKFSKNPSNPRQVTFEFNAAFRRSYFGAPALYSTVYDDNWNYGDGVYESIPLYVKEVDTNLDLIVVQWTGTHTYAGAGDYTVGWVSCCRIFALNNNPSYGYAHTAFVRLTAAEISSGIVNNSPTTGFSPILRVDYGVTPYIYFVTASDPENQGITWSQATPTQQGDSVSTHPTGMTLNTATGEVHLNSILAQGYWTTQQIITDAHGNWISIDYLLDVQPRATFCNGFCSGTPNPVCEDDADCVTCNTTCIDASPRLITADLSASAPTPRTNLPSPANQQTFNRNVGQQVVVNYVADDANLKNPQTPVQITFSATPAGSVTSSQVPCDAINGCSCPDCNGSPQLRTLTWTPTAANIGGNTVCVQVKSQGNDIPFPNNPWCITINVIAAPITSGALTSGSLTTDQVLTTGSLTTSFATVAARCSTYTFPETQGYFCAADGSGYYQCLKGPWAPQANFRPCAPGTSCKCPVGVECSAQGICTFGPWNGPY
jgi:hypothetical protein